VSRTTKPNDHAKPEEVGPTGDSGDAGPSSRHAWIWPASDFTVSLDCRATDGAGKVIWETSLKAEAHLPLPEVNRDHSRAGQEAIKEAFLELQNRIVTSGAFR
jgi:hypothetical protein